MSARRILITDFLNHSLFFMMFFSVIIIPLSLIKHNTSEIYVGLIIFIPFILMYVIRKYIKTFFIFTGLHIFFFLLPFFLSTGPTQRNTFVVFLAIAIIFSYRDFFSEVKVSFRISTLYFAVAIIFIVYLLTNKLQLLFLHNFLATYTMLLCTLFILYNHVASINYSLDIISKTTNQPIKMILKFNNISIFIYIGVMVVFVFVSLYFHVEVVLKLVGSILFLIMKSLLHFLNIKNNVSNIKPAEQAGSNHDFRPEALQNDLINQIILAIENVLINIFAVAFALGIIAVIGYSIYYLYKSFYHKGSEQGDIKEFITPALFINFNIKMKRDKKNNDFGMGNEKKIRKIFYKKINYYIHKGVSIQNSDTPRQIEEKLNKEDIKSLREVYEKVRYGNKEVTKDDFKNIR